MASRSLCAAQAQRRPAGDQAPAAKPAWRLSDPRPPQGPPGRGWKWLLAAAIVLQIAWIVALAAMAIR
jgi:hypothetical protein